MSVAAAGGGAEIASGRTGVDGRWAARLPAGTYEVSYRLEGYVPYTSGATEVREDGQLVTVSLSRLLEATESGGREVRIILNWGSRPDQVRDADSHLACPCGASDESRLLPEPQCTRRRTTRSSWTWTTRTGEGRDDHAHPPVPGTYLYWVHDYSGPPARLGASDVVVRVVIGSQEAGEFRIFKGVTRRAWRPVQGRSRSAADGQPTLVRFTEDEIAEAADLAVPPELQPPTPSPRSAARPAEPSAPCPPLSSCSR